MTLRLAEFCGPTTILEELVVVNVVYIVYRAREWAFFNQNVKLLTRNGYYEYAL